MDFAPPFALRLLVQHLVNYQTGVHSVGIDLNQIGTRSFYECIVQCGVPVVIVHENYLLLDRYQRWSVEKGHSHVLHVHCDQQWDAGDDLTQYLAAPLVVSIGCTIPPWLIQPSKRVKHLHFMFTRS